jgi:hypothetical protein
VPTGASKSLVSRRRSLSWSDSCSHVTIVLALVMMAVGSSLQHNREINAVKLVPRKSQLELTITTIDKV